MTTLIAQEWISKRGGSELVAARLVGLLGAPEIVTMWSDVGDTFAGARVNERWLAKTPLRRAKSLAMPFMLEAWRGVKTRETVDRIVCSSHLFAHHLTLDGQPDVPKFAYVHSPARYLWEPSLDPRGASAPARVVARPLKAIDRKRSQESVSIAANSHFVAERILRAWGRESTVIYPPVDVARVRASVEAGPDALSPGERQILDGLPAQYVLGASRFVTYKRLDLVIRAAAHAGLPCVIAGGGALEGDLRRLAASVDVPVTFVIEPSTRLLHMLMARALVFVFPAIEDFGIIPVESMAAGTPVVVGPVGGARETVVDGVGGAVAESDEPGSIAAAILRAADVPSGSCSDAADGFASSVFDERIARWLS